MIKLKESASPSDVLKVKFQPQPPASWFRNLQTHFNMKVLLN